MFCRKCGKSIPDDSIFCSYCGESVKLSELTYQPDKPENSKEMDIETAIYGRCGQCGKPLQPDDGALCECCAAKLINRSMPKPENTNQYPFGYPFASCDRCAKPLEQDDKCGMCKNCLHDLKNEEKQAIGEAPFQSGSFYTPGKIRPVEIPKRKHGWLIAVLVCIGLIVVIGIIGNMSQTTPTTVNGSNTSSAKTESEINSLPSNSTPASKAPESKATTSKASSKVAISSKAKRKKATTKAKQSTAQPDENGEVNKYTYDKATDSSVQSVPKSGDPNLDFQAAAQDAMEKYSNP